MFSTYCGVADAKISPGKSPLTIISVIILFPLEHFLHIQTQPVIGHCYSIAVKLSIAPIMYYNRRNINC